MKIISKMFKGAQEWNKEIFASLIIKGAKNTGVISKTFFTEGFLFDKNKKLQGVNCLYFSELRRKIKFSKKQNFECLLATIKILWIFIIIHIIIVTD